MPDSYRKAVVEELAGAISSELILTVIGLTAGGAAMLGEPVTGCVLLGASVFYGTLLKVKAGRMYESSSKPVMDSSTIENSIVVDTIPEDKSHGIVKIKSKKFAFVRLLTSSKSKIVPA